MVAKAEISQQTSRPTAAAILLVFFSVAGICLILPTVAFYHMMVAIFQADNNVLIDKGVYYLFGAGIAMSFLLLDGIYNSLIRQPVPGKIKQAVGATALLGLALIVILPTTVHYASAYLLEQRGYEICEAASSQWLFVRDIVYTIPGACD
ncbi:MULTISPECIES: hypothetical protein [Microbulbifer]|uniref:hypothetical protein n=1 Tax=Microbulbifer TaxID=48073 RepID=UPI001C94CD16|nr:hypothetical protein [Microbulbifer agarilyticus]MBY6190939.1 hypothetical protein [Microbulbifer agarilyticus]MCA0900040.1 hypothetical protein [Microbulbifer agarilyticus]